jgi:hypothetical protein
MIVVNNSKTNHVQQVQRPVEALGTVLHRCARVSWVFSVSVTTVSSDALGTS